jgi:hypothetical protein
VLAALRPLVESRALDVAVIIKTSKMAAAFSAWAVAVYEFSRAATDERTPTDERARMRAEGLAHALSRARAAVARAEAFVATRDGDLRAEDDRVRAAPAPPACAPDALAAASAGIQRDDLRMMLGLMQPPRVVVDVVNAVGIVFSLEDKGKAGEMCGAEPRAPPQHVILSSPRAPHACKTHTSPSSQLAVSGDSAQGREFRAAPQDV